MMSSACATRPEANAALVEVLGKSESGVRCRRSGSATITFLRFALVVLLVELITPAHGADQVATGSSLAGTWTLIAFSFQKEDGTVTYPFGQYPEGIAIYDAAGHMSVQIMRRDIPKFRSRERTVEPTDAETRTAYEGFIGYGGNYETDADRKNVVFHVKVSSYPNWVGMNLKRSFEFAADRLTLRAKIPSMEGIPATLVQVWARTD